MEFLKEYLTEETFAKLEAELQDKGEQVKLVNLKSGDYVSKDKYSALETANGDLKSQLTAKSAAYDELIKKSGDNENLKAEIEALKKKTQEQLDTTVSQYESKLKASAINSELIKAKAKDAKDILGLLDMDRVTYKDDALTGLAEQIDSLKGTKPYLFEEEQQKGKSGLSHENNDDAADANAIRAVLGLPIKK